MIPQSEIIVQFARSGGPGGQNVNKVSTKAIARWHVGNSRSFSFEQKWLIRKKLTNRLASSDEVIASCDENRSQLQNKIKAIKLLQTLVSNSLKVPKKRLATKPTRASKEKRLVTKTLHARIKKNRSKSIEW